MIGIVIPAHDEESVIGPCMAHALACASDPLLGGERVEIMVVADRCSDATAAIAARSGANVLAIDARNVGWARAAGANALLALGARWLAFTDADTLVAEDWLSQQLALDAYAVCGTVAVDDWTPHGENALFLSRHFATSYRDADGHRHVHGANLGVAAHAYLRAGGFQELVCSEDVALVTELERTGSKICWSARPRVRTSARKVGRAPGGFADALLNAVASQFLGKPAAA